MPYPDSPLSPQPTPITPHSEALRLPPQFSQHLGLFTALCFLLYSQLYIQLEDRTTAHGQGFLLGHFFFSVPGVRPNGT